MWGVWRPGHLNQTEVTISITELGLISMSEGLWT